MMDEIVVRRFVNHADVNKQDNLTLCSEWKGNTCTVFIFGQNIALKGELSEELIKQFSTNLSKSPECYIQETKQNFALKDTDVQFHLKEEKFRWKKAIWNLGSIKMCPINNMTDIAEFQRKLLHNFEYFQNSINQMKSQNKTLSTNQTQWEKKLNELIQIKQSMEHELYKKFLLILNKKKQRIRELEDLLKSKEKDKDVYEEQTDDSQDLMKNYKKRKSNSNRFVPKRIRNSDDSLELNDIYCRKGTEKSTDVVVVEKEREVIEKDESSSTNVSTQDESSKVEKKTEESTQTKRLDVESDDDICLKLTDESTQSAEKNESKFQNSRRKIIESESEDDLFS